MWDDPRQENWFFVSGWGRISKTGKWKQVVVREKTKFEMKILWGKRKVRWAKRREGQNMWIEIHYSIKSSDLICINLLDKKLMLKSYTRKKITKHVVFISVASYIYHCFFLSGSASGDIRCWPRLALGSLFKTSRDLLSLAVSFNC